MPFESWRKNNQQTTKAYSAINPKFWLIGAYSYYKNVDIMIIIFREFFLVVPWGIIPRLSDILAFSDWENTNRAWDNVPSVFQDGMVTLAARMFSSLPCLKFYLAFFSLFREFFPFVPWGMLPMLPDLLAKARRMHQKSL